MDEPDTCAEHGCALQDYEINTDETSGLKFRPTPAYGDQHEFVCLRLCPVCIEWEHAYGGTKPTLLWWGRELA